MPPLDLQSGPLEVAAGCVRIPLPDPFVPGVTAVFLVGPADSPWLVDAGAATDECAAALCDELASLGHAAEALPMILTHTHLDHAGGLLLTRPRELTAHERAVAEMRETAPRSSRGPEALRRMGLPPAAVAELAPEGEPIHGTPLAGIPVDHALSGPSGHLPGADGWSWVLAEGHAPGHLMLFDAGTSTLLGADQFLQKWKTPLIVSDPDFDSFGAYLASIDAALALSPARICSSHTETIEPAVPWLEETRAALERRLGRVEEAVAGGAETAEETLSALYPTASRGPLRIVFLREHFAMLRYLAARERLHRQAGEDGVERFVPVR
jgi:glyoxylase-like metal-dependent hydrolase (beta-lactamase superfamily II)